MNQAKNRKYQNLSGFSTPILKWFKVPLLSKKLRVLSQTQEEKKAESSGFCFFQGRLLCFVYWFLSHKLLSAQLRSALELGQLASPSPNSFYYVHIIYDFLPIPMIYTNQVISTLT